MTSTNEVPDADAALVAGRQPPSARVPSTGTGSSPPPSSSSTPKGLPGLTMRRLGESLGVEAMSLYRYVPGKEDLLDAIVDTLVLSMAQDDEVLASPRDGWQDFLQRLAHGVRRVALQHPRVFPLVASRPPEAPWLRPPLRSIDWVEDFLSGLISEGFTDESAVAGYRAFTSFLLGHLLLEVATHGGDIGPLDVIDDGSPDYGNLDSAPTVLRLRDALSEDRAAMEFEEALEDLLDRLALLRAEGNTA